ncbi:MAG: hypothetical protein HUU55_21325 [Myxococcales bacterium]|nr:hypothetical protein [Myxococcales bacterium]
MRFRRWCDTLVIIVGFSTLFITHPASAVSPTVSYVGELSSPNGVSFTGDVSVGVALFPSAADGTAIFTEDLGTISVSSGRFDVVIGALAPTSLTTALLSSDDLWVQFTIAGEVLSPRQKLHSVPTALIAGDALQLGGTEASEFLTTSDVSPVALSNNFGDLDNIPPELADGDGDVLANLNCPPNGVPRFVSDSWTCVVPSDNDTLKTLEPVCTDGQIVKKTGGGWACADESMPTAGQVPTYTADPYVCDPNHAGEIYFNTVSAKFIGCDGSGWRNLQMLTDAGASPEKAGRDCQDLLNKGVSQSGVYWIDPDGEDVGPPTQVYCDQVTNGGGWALLLNSVGSPTGATLSFWQIAYANRLAVKGSPNPFNNYYNPSLYAEGKVYMDVVEDLTGKSAVLMTAAASGINSSTMTLSQPKLLSGSSAIYTNHFASGWAASDADVDMHYSSNCAAYYNNVAQHYHSCWSYNLGSDADLSGGTLADNGWGPHVSDGVLGSLGLHTDGSPYCRVNRISRFVKMCSGPGCTKATAQTSCQNLLNAGQTSSGLYWIDLTGGDPSDATRIYCDMDNAGGGWAVLYNSVGTVNGSTTAFWQIPYLLRMTPKGTSGIGDNYYNPAYYLTGTQYAEIFEDLNRKTIVAFVASVTGFNPTTMRFINPNLISGNSGNYGCQFAAGWSAVDYDGDTEGGSNCSESYCNVTQHYCGCWNSNIGCDADNSGGNVTDGGWGPHLGNAQDWGLYDDGSAYDRLRRITRLVKW